MTRWKIRKAILTLTVVALGQLAVAQENAAPETGSSNAKSAPTSRSTPSGHPEGMQVHGHWTVTVRNGDGSVASRHEFENSVTGQGTALMLNLLIGRLYSVDALPPVWQLKIGGPACAQQQTGYCLIAVQPDLNHGGVDMIGTFKMAIAGQITSVATEITNTRGPQHNPLHFSIRDLTQSDSATGQTPAPINVQAGQNVDFTVDISIT